MIRWILKTLAMAGGFIFFWTVLVGNAQPQEVLVGALSVAAAACFTMSARRAQQRRFRYTIRDLFQVRRVPWNVLTDTWRVIAVLLRNLVTGRPPASSYIVVPFKLSQPDAGLDGREVLAVTYATASPNSIVLGARRDERQILVHLLEQAPLSSVMKVLGMGRGSDA